MASNRNIQALKQVEMGLCVLYGGGYFSDEEFAQLNLIINKKAKASPGPTPDMLDNLISFEETPKPVQAPSTNSMSHQTPASFTQPKAPARENPVPPRAEPAVLPPKGGLALTPLEEAKRFQAQVRATMRPKKSKPKAKHSDHSSNPPPKEDDLRPLSLAQQPRSQSWASEVNSPDQSPVLSVAMLAVPPTSSRAKTEKEAYQRALAEAAQRQLQNRDVTNDLDHFEELGAADWDEISQTKKSRNPKVPAPKPKAPLGLATSRFAVLADEGASSSENEKQDQNTPPSASLASQGGTGRVAEEQVVSYLHEKLKPPKTHHHPVSKQLSPVSLPKTEICWYWATPGRDCRFTAEECKNLHELPADGSVLRLSLRNGKPNWGAAADYPQSLSSDHTPNSHSIPNLSSPPAFGPYFGPAEPIVESDIKTCYFWAKWGTCKHSKENCLYLHARSTAGIANSLKFSKVGRPDTWTRWQAGGESAPPTPGAMDSAPDSWGKHVNSEAIKGWVQSGGGGAGGWALSEGEVSEDHGSSSGELGWGEDPTDTYKPPYLRDLEQKEADRLRGW